LTSQNFLTFIAAGEAAGREFNSDRQQISDGTEVLHEVESRFAARNEEREVTVDLWASLHFSSRCSCMSVDELMIDQVH
jgi:hypothetical protein